MLAAAGVLAGCGGNTASADSPADACAQASAQVRRILRGGGALTPAVTARILKIERRRAERLADIDRPDGVSEGDWKAFVAAAKLVADARERQLAAAGSGNPAGPGAVMKAQAALHAAARRAGVAGC